MIDPTGDDFDSTADSWRNRYGPHRTVHRTGTTLHTGVEIKNNRLFLDNVKNAMGAHGLAITAANTGLIIESERRCIFYIAEIFHRISQLLS